ncbi:MAG: zeta toxin family protein [Meiothermus sp.]|nr:zeta toxin family protein [Meiothermus sp.]
MSKLRKAVGSPPPPATGKNHPDHVTAFPIKPEPHHLAGFDGAKQFVDKLIDHHVERLNHLQTQGHRVPWGHAHITMGVGGSGKGTYLSGHHLAPHHHGAFLHLDPDNFKQLHPDYHPDKMKDSSFVHSIHKFSKDLEDYAFHRAKEKRVPMVIDTVGDNVHRLTNRIGALRQSGYGKQAGGHIGIKRVKVSLETSLKRNQMRPRRVPEHVLQEQSAQHDPMHPENLEHGTPYQRLSKLVDSARTVDYEDHQVKAAKSRQAWEKYRAAEKQFAKSLLRILKQSIMGYRRRKNA